VPRQEVAAAISSRWVSTQMRRERSPEVAVALVRQGVPWGCHSVSRLSRVTPSSTPPGWPSEGGLPAGPLRPGGSNTLTRAGGMAVAWSSLLMLGGWVMLVGVPPPPLQVEECSGERSVSGCVPMQCVPAGWAVPQLGVVAIGIGTLCLLASVGLVRRRRWALRGVVVSLLVVGGAAVLTLAWLVCALLAGLPLRRSGSSLVAQLLGSFVLLLGYFVTVRKARSDGAEPAQRSGCDRPPPQQLC